MNVAKSMPANWASNCTDTPSPAFSPVPCSVPRRPASWPASGPAEVDPDLFEWDYGRFEGQLTSDVLKERPGWELFRDGCPDGESPEDVALRADRFLARVQGIAGDVLAFSSGHIIRMIAARWLGLPPRDGRLFYCRPASVGVLGYEHNSPDQPIIRLWNYFVQLRSDVQIKKPAMELGMIT